MYAPYGAGVLVTLRDVVSETPDMLGGGIVDLVTLDSVVWSDIPEREEAGSPNVTGVVALAAAVQKLQDIGMDRIERHERALVEHALEQFSALPEVRVLGPRSAEQRVGVLAFTVDGVPANLAAAVLSYEWAIGVRAGCFCAHPAMTHLLRITDEQAADFQRQIRARVRTSVPGAVRASLGLQSSSRDLDRLFTALRTLVHDGVTQKYQLDVTTGEYTPVDWNPVYEQYFSV